MKKNIFKIVLPFQRYKTVNGDSQVASVRDFKKFQEKNQNI